MIEPLPTQISGAKFLASRRTALLADQPRVGKTLAAIWAANKIGARRILVVTTASGRAVWRKAWKDSQSFPWIETPEYARDIHVVGVDKNGINGIQIISWDSIRQSKVFAALKKQRFDVYILDEDHRAKNPHTKTAQAIYGRFNVYGDRIAAGIVADGETVWHLTGTPMPHDPGDMWCRLRASNELCLVGTPHVIAYDDFRDRYCVIVQKKLKWNTIPVVVGGRNLDELKARIGDWMLRRTQQDVGIRPPVFELMPLIVKPEQRRQIKTDLTQEQIIAAIEQNRTAELDMHLGPLRRITGRLKAEAIIGAVDDALEGNTDKLVLAYFHREVGDILEQRLTNYLPERVDGGVSAGIRAERIHRFQTRLGHGVFLAQIDACGEAIDLSAAAELWFVESVFSPKSMAQMSARISNVDKTKTTFVKVAYIENSIDEAIQASLLRLWRSINQVLA